jgi:hypothetical protein
MVESKNIRKKLMVELHSASKQLDEELSKEVPEPSEEIMKIVYSNRGPESPFEVAPAAKKGLKAYSGDYWGAFSLEKFASASGLRYTHEDAAGWLNYLQKFKPRNFWYRDSNVRIWAYYEQYDNWQDTYGMDAVLAVYHSGHGGMTGDGRFHAPLGADWGGQGTTAWSNKMKLGNEQARYIFWSTCLSCRVLGGHSPMRTWHPANLGFRILFGYETVSYDNPNYGKYFWQEWNKKKSFSSAFLDASWRISHRQAPAVVACGATKDEAKNRVFNERKFYWGAVSRNWYWWRWYYAASSATAARALNQDLPKLGQRLIAELKPRVVDRNYVSSIISRHDVGIGLPKEVLTSPDGIFSVLEGKKRIAFESDGSYEIQLTQPNPDNMDQISMQKAVNIAQDFMKQHGLDQEKLIFDRIMLSHEAGGEAGSGQIDGPYVNETVIQFTQQINGIPVLLPGKGCVSVTIDNDGTVTSVKNSTRSIDRLTEQLKNAPSTPDEDRPVGEPNPEQLLAEAWQERMKDWLLKGRMPRQYSIVPGTYEIGYAIKGNEALLVARNDIEVDCGSGYLKRYSIEVPIFE